MSSGRHDPTSLEWHEPPDDQEEVERQYQHYIHGDLGEDDYWNIDLLQPFDEEEDRGQWIAWNGADEAEDFFSQDPLASSSTLDESSPPSRSRDNRVPRLRSPSPTAFTPPRRPMGNASSTSYNPSLSRSENRSRAQPQPHRRHGLNQPSRSATSRAEHTRPRSPGQPIHLFETFDFENLDDQPTSPESFDGVDIDDLLASDSEEGEEDNTEVMPAASTARLAGERSIVDLTQDSSSPRSSSRKRSATTTNNDTASRPRKRTRASPSSCKPSSPAKIEELDLTTTESLLQHQLTSALRTQQQATATDSTPLNNIGKRQCMICLDRFTNVTVTHCGHIFCHECLTQALRAGEKNSERSTGNCPACRKPVSMKKAGNMIVVSFMKRGAFVGKGGKPG